MRFIMMSLWLFISVTSLFAIMEDEKIAEAREAYRSQDYAKAEQLYQSVIRVVKNNAQYRFELGMVYVAQERYTMARVAMERAISIDKEHLLAHYNLAKIYVQLKKDTQAIRIYEWLIDRYPYFPPAYLNLANIALKKGDYSLAKNLYSYVIRLDNNLTEAYMGLIWIATQEEQWMDAELYLEQWEAVDPDDVRITEWKETLANVLLPS